jgi:formylglycine-generating enzyme required for sulfatase activity
VSITGGAFMMGSTKEEAAAAGEAFERYYLEKGDEETAKRARSWPEDEINHQSVAVTSFEIARYPITNAQYALFLADDGYNPDQPWWDAAGRAWLDRDDAATEGLDPWQRRESKHQPEYWEQEQFGKTRPNYPVVGISWYEAMAFCRWLTQHQGYNPGGRYLYRLPSEAEWEYAARDVERRAYPWGIEEPDGERSNYDEQYNETTAVGCFPLGSTPEGVSDLAGNVWEWTRSFYKLYPYDPDDGREEVNDLTKKRFTIRGGSWSTQSSSLRAPYRNIYSPADRSLVVGMRLARHLAV